MPYYETSSRSLAPALRHAAAHQGVITREELLSHGYGSTSISRMASAEFVRRVHTGVYAIGGSPTTWNQLLSAAVSVSKDAVVSHRSALLLWGMSWSDREIVEIQVPRPCRPVPRGVICHRSRDLESHWVTELGNYPVTTPERTLVDLAGIVGPMALQIALNEALVKGLTTVAKCSAALEEMAKRGRSGVRRLRAELAAQAGVDVQTESVLERVFVSICGQAGLPAPVPQFWVDTGSGPRRLDFAYPSLRIAIELDGYSVHSRREVFEDDRRRQNQLELAGWLVLRFTHADLRDRPEYVSATVRNALRVRGSLSVA